MTVKTHIVSSLVVSLPLAIIAEYIGLFDISEIINDHLLLSLLLAGVIFGSTFPDIDEPQSYIGRKIPFVSFFLSAFIQHRGITHTFIILFLYVLLFYFLQSYFDLYFDERAEIFMLGFIFGNIGHIFGDATTKSGVAVFYPFSSKQFGMLPKRYRYVTGSSVEYIIILPIFSALLFYEYTYLVK